MAAGVGIPEGGGFAPERRRLIEQLMDQEGRVSVGQLSRRFGVSEVTIRKDLSWLQAQDRLVRTHGGAIASDRSHAELAFEVRERLQRAEKQAIAAAAAALVQPGDSLALDASTTALQIARHLNVSRELTVVTNGLHVAAELASIPGISVLMPGGRLRWEAFSLVGSWGDDFLSRVNIQRAFMGAVGFTLEAGLTDVTEEEASIKRAMIRAAREVVAVIDHTKWDRVSAATFCPTNRISLVITDSKAPADMVAAVEKLGIRVQLVDAGRIAAAHPPIQPRARARERLGASGPRARRAW